MKRNAHFSLEEESKNKSEDNSTQQPGCGQPSLSPSDTPGTTHTSAGGSLLAAVLPGGRWTWKSLVSLAAGAQHPCGDVLHRQPGPAAAAPVPYLAERLGARRAGIAKVSEGSWEWDCGGAWGARGAGRGRMGQLGALAGGHY